MRGLLVCAVVAALVAPVFGGESQHTGVIEITTPGAQLGVGCQGQEAYVIEWCDLPSPTFYVDIYVSSTDVGGMSAFQLTLTGCDGLNLHAATTYYGNVLNYAGQYAANSERGGDGFADKGWDMVNALAWSAQSLPMAGPPAEQVGTVNAGAGVFGQNGWAAWAKLDTPTEPCEELPCCCIDAADLGMGDSNFDGLPLANIQVIPLCILPEPATALLLLAGLPLLRRRR
jgi:hypothetical protein